MPVEPGQTLLHYRLTEKIGEGGMGVVWKAVDTTLDRDVAIKILPDTFSSNPERLARFEREAKLLASLQHPNIAVLHGLHEAPSAHSAGSGQAGSGQAGSVRFLTMELVGGEDLTERLVRGPLPFVESIDAAIQIAEALAAAHDSGVIHRDLKPANVRIAPDGQIKVLDFGLAKADSPSEAATSGEGGPTLTSAGTVAGVILGTAAYMSPEQARGRPVDRRSDVWSFGCVLYEMLTGRQAFAGETVSDMIAGILTREPDWDHLPAEAPAGVRRVLRRCLQKDLRERTRDLGDVALDLREARDEQSSEPEAAVVRSSQTKVWPALTALLLVALIVSIGTRWWPGSTSRSGLQADHLVVEMKPLIDKAGAQHSGALSPDGRGLLYVADEGGDQDVFFQRVGGENPINLTRNSPEDDLDPEFSPDGERIAFRSDRDGGGIFVMGATGESPRRVTDMGYEPTWSPDGKSLVFSTHPGADPYWARDDAELWVVDVETLDKRQLPQGSGAAVAPRFSPNGRRIAFWSTRGGQRDVYTIPAEGGEPVPVTDDPDTDWSPFWSRDGRWLFFVSDRGGTPDLWRVPIDERSGRVLGPLQPVTTGVARVWAASMARDASRVVLGINGDLGELAKVTLDPESERLTGEPVTIHTGSDPFVEIDLSPSEEWIAFRTMGSREHVMTVRSDGSEQRQLTDDRNRNRGPRWSPNGEWLAIYSNRDGEYKIWALRPDGTGLRRLTDSSVGTFDPVWSPDGSRLAVNYAHEEDWAIGFLDLPAEGIDGLEEIPELLKPAGAFGFFAEAWSPDGRHLLGGQTVGSASIAAVYSVAEDRVDLMHDPEGTPIIFNEGSAGWIDENRAVVGDQNSRNAYVHDLRSGTVRVLPGIPVPGDFTIGDGGRTLILSRTRLESDIWMLSLGE